MTRRWHSMIAALAAAGALAWAGGASADGQTPGAVGPESAAAQPTTPPAQTPPAQPTGATGTATTGTTATTTSGVDARAEERRTTEISDEQADVEDTTEVAEDDDTSPREERGRGYMFVGAFYRHMMVPEFLIDLFAEADDTYFNPALGGEFTYRRNGFDITAAVWWASFNGEGSFRGQGDPESDTEIVNSELSTIFASASFMWSTEFNEYVAFSYGVDVGIGFVLGELRRSEAYQAAGGGDFGDYSACTGPGVGQGGLSDASTQGVWCDVVDPDLGPGTANVLEDGVPPVAPWLALPHLALRIKPIRQLMIRIDLGFSVLGFFSGIAVNYGFDPVGEAEESSTPRGEGGEGTSSRRRSLEARF